MSFRKMTQHIQYVATHTQNWTEWKIHIYLWLFVCTTQHTSFNTILRHSFHHHFFYFGFFSGTLLSAWCGRPCTDPSITAGNVRTLCISETFFWCCQPDGMKKCPSPFRMGRDFIITFLPYRARGVYEMSISNVNLYRVLFDFFFLGWRMTEQLSMMWHCCLYQHSYFCSMCVCVVAYNSKNGIFFFLSVYYILEVQSSRDICSKPIIFVLYSNGSFFHRVSEQMNSRFFIVYVNWLHINGHIRDGNINEKKNGWKRNMTFVRSNRIETNGKLISHVWCGVNLIHREYGHTCNLNETLFDLSLTLHTRINDESQFHAAEMMFICFALNSHLTRDNRTEQKKYVHYASHTSSLHVTHQMPGADHLLPKFWLSHFPSLLLLSSVWRWCQWFWYGLLWSIMSMSHADDIYNNAVTVSATGDTQKPHIICHLQC